MSKLKVFFIPTNVSGVVFYRMWQPYLALKELRDVEPMIWWYETHQFEMHRWEWEIRDQEKGPYIVRDIDCGIRWADVVIWMGLHTTDSLNLFRQMKAKHDKPFISEFDDYLFSIPQKNAAFEAYKPGTIPSQVGAEQIKMSDGVICSTPILKELYEPLNSNIGVVENVINLALWRSSTVSPVRQRVTIGWVGGATHEEDLELVKEPLMQVLSDNKNVQFICMHGIPAFLKNKGGKIKLIKSFKPIDKYPKWVSAQKFDVGIAPLVDNTFNRGKSNLRWLEYSAMGIPTVASALPHFTSSIRDGETGFIAGSPERWVESLKILIRDSYLRKAMGWKAREEIKENWNFKTLGRKYKKVIEGLINAKSYESGFGLPSARPDQRPQRLSVVGTAEAR